METLARLCRRGPGLLVATPYRVVDLDRRGEPSARGDRVVGGAHRRAAARAWSSSRCDCSSRGKRGLVAARRQVPRAASTCASSTAPSTPRREHLERLRARGLGAKRALALREFALGLEALERFVDGEPLYRVHECVFGVLALESEPVDPRL